MTRQGVENLGTADLDLVFLENVGNLVCPAEFDTGAAKNMMILSVPEGDDKPLKYPLMFTVSDVVLINKIDTKSVFDFDDQAVQERILKLNPQAKIFFISAKTGEGMDAVRDWLRQQVRDCLSRSCRISWISRVPSMRKTAKTICFTASRSPSIYRRQNRIAQTNKWNISPLCRVI